MTAKNLAKRLAELGAKIKTRDVFVFYLAGHGKTKDGQYYFLPHDFRYRNAASIQQSGVGQDDWRKWLAQIPARKSILLYDTCESGALTGARIAMRGVERRGRIEVGDWRQR